MSLGLALSGGSVFGAAWMASIVFFGRTAVRPYKTGTRQRSPTETESIALWQARALHQIYWG